MTKLTQNKGEWSESYLLFYIIANQLLILCDEKLVSTDEILEIEKAKIIYQNNDLIFELYENYCQIKYQNISLTKENEYFRFLAKNVLTEITQNLKTTFEIEKVNSFLDLLGIKKIKSKSLSKSDIFLFPNDTKLIEKSFFGFSIKSFLSSSPTLVNASKATNFTFSIKNITNNDYFELKSKNLVRQLFKDESTLIFQNIDSEIFSNNLLLIDTNMTNILAESLKIYYSSNYKYIKDICAELIKINPLKLNNTDLYAHKLKDYLFHASLNMIPDKPWSGINNPENGGSIIICNDGNIKSFYIIREQYLKYYRDFLFNNCFFDTASNSRHGFGKIYKDNNKYMLKLNLQIRINQPKL
jgi:type II restriction enzyme